MEKYRKALLLSLKIGIGSCAAIYIAQSMHLDYAISSGTVTLLTLMTSKWGTIKLSVYRIVSFFTTIAIAWIFFTYIDSEWLAFGLLVAMIVFVAEYCGWRATISINAVIAAHLATDLDFSTKSILNEFFLVMIGVVIAVILNLFNANLTHKRQIISSIRYTEEELRKIVRELAAFLSGREMSENVWNDICKLEREIQKFIRDAEDYQDNTFQSHPEYYINYFKMRNEQCQILNSLHYELKKIGSLPKQAEVIAEYLLYLADYILETNRPDEQIEELNKIFANMKNEDLPKSREEFENRALLYHILIDIDDFLLCKAEFVDGLDSKQLKRYWKNG